RRARRERDDHRRSRTRPVGVEPQARSSAPTIPRRSWTDAPSRRRSDPRADAGRGSRTNRLIHAPGGGPSMKFRAVRASALGQVDAVIVPLGSDGGTPPGLPRPIKTVVDRIARGQTGAGRPGDYDAERARNIAAAGVKSLWRSNVKKLALFIAPNGLGEDRAVQAAVEGAVYAMWRPEAHRTREEDRRLPPLDSVLLVTEKPVTKAIARGEAVGDAVNLQRRLANEPANKMTPTLLANEARAAAKESGVECEVLDAARCRALGMGSYLSVAQGSHEEPRFIVMRYHGRRGKNG